MAKLIYSLSTSLDGYVADEDGNFDWTAPDEEVHRFVNDRLRDVGTYLFGRRLYDVMMYWEALPVENEPAVIRDYAEIWRNTDKVVYSRSLDAPTSERTRIERDFDPDAVREMKASADRDLEVGGPHLAAQAFRAGLVDEIRLFVAPVVIGGGNPALPSDLRLPLELLDERRFGNGTVYLRYRTGALAPSATEDRATADA